MSNIDKDALIETLAQKSCDEIDLKDLERFYYDSQVEYLERMDDTELVEYANEYGGISKEEIKTDYTLDIEDE